MRTPRAALCISIALVNGCSAAQTANHAEYYSADRHNVAIFDGKNGYIGINPDFPDYASSDSQKERMLSPLKDVPLRGGTCRAYGQFTFANLDAATNNSSFSCNGLIFHIHCDTASGCSSYRVSAYCGIFKDGACRTKAEDLSAGPLYTYGYKRNLGVTYIDFAPSDLNHRARLQARGVERLLL
jgi:hypothetical protein